ncbi:hypothetical protein SCUCBS95973_000798 [Sporothrix curviconia]|uniref:Amidase domain-containing protein n=1 Tax=Sporothrix curviconia TaxID=1260050 RepID=A0ABP0ATA4_9PEZI
MSSTTVTATATPATEPISLPTKSWQSIVAAKQAEQFSRIPEAWRLTPEMLPAEGTIDLRPTASTCGILSERELLITGETYDATSLADEVAKGTYSATETITAFCKRAAVGQQLCSFMTEICFNEAIEKAKKLDEHYRATGKTVGPLHGLAITFKECFHVKGFDACNGYVSRCFDKSTTTTPIIQLVEEAGAVLIGKTNIPQTMLVAECHNNVFGQTKNPVVSNLSCGGSSGGEGSIAAWHGSSLGVGTDVGGSIRLPAAFNAVYGYKPSVGVLPFIGYAPSGWSGVNSGIPAVLGPLGQSIRDMRLFTKVVRAQKPWTFDPAVIPGVMEVPLPEKKPVVGILYESGIKPHPPVRRALHEAVAKLEVAGYEVRDFTPTCPDFKEIRDIAAEMLTSDGLSYQTRELAKSGEPAVPSVVNFGYWGNPRLEHEEVWALGTRKGAMQKAMLDAWQALGIDILIAPSAPHTPIQQDRCTSELYTVAWNVMDYPAIIVPFGHADKAKDVPDTEFTPMNDLDAKIHTWYDAELMHNSPTSLQLVGPRLGDAALLHFAEELDAVLHA